MDKFYLAGDVSKGYTDFIILDQNKKVVESVFQLDDTYEGHNELFNIISSFLDSHPGSILYCGFESTGGLENNWVNMLSGLSEILNIKTARINPLGPVALHKASLERNGTDSISAKYIAQYMIVYPNKVSYNIDDPYSSLRKQWNLIEMYQKQKTQLLNQLSIHIYTSFPFLVKYCKNATPNWVLLLLKQYPSASKLSRSREITLGKIRYISKTRSKKIVEDAKHNIASHDDEVTSLVIKSTVDQVLNLKKNILLLKENMTTNCDLPEVKLLTSFNGIGAYSAIGLILNIISIDRFPSAKHLSSYFGLHPVYKQSGDKKGAYRMSKKGRSAPRKILYMVARSAVINNSLIKEVYIDHKKRGKTGNSALGVCMHKILRIVYGMLKHNNTFDAQIDKRNRNKTRTTSTKAIVKLQLKKRRFQQEADDAPISRRQTIHRKKRKQSQSELSELAGSELSLP